ncbi:MAG: DNA-binding response regulator [Flammeovirgaceae bacterium]|nr:DNA-binding response regulator [Flammeovirgaceae bacterium]MBR06397.1 DNA-binding response regulator [Rickettsiales bacterium]MBR11352.1 DNA-binding response regulator [Rickettsiales bacterium]HCX21699.1 DNA-binding response regulator [Cytophagales bacterium]|tara:strand:+ start:4923 stop:5552 length:630 start_codon:yes stop_codon:yes gene_type:complete
MSKIRVLVVDDHQLFREGIRSIFSSNSDIEVIGEADSVASMMTSFESELPEVVLIDVTMPGGDGISAIKQCKKQYPNVRFVVLTMHADGQYVVKAARSGAFGYLLKNADKEELTKAIKEASFGRKYFNSEISQLMVGNMSLEGDDPQQLSERELQVLQLVSDGKTTKEIADELFVSSRTVETHRVNMMKKLNVQNSAELIKKAVKLNLI